MSLIKLEIENNQSAPILLHNMDMNLFSPISLWCLPKAAKKWQKVPKISQNGKKCLPLNTITGAVQHGNNILCIMKRSNITMMSSINNGHGLQAQTLHFYKNKSIICNFEKKKNQKWKKYLPVFGVSMNRW